MAPYSPPSGGRANKLRLDFNENTVGCSPHVLKRIRERLSEDALTIYPEYADAKRELAEFFGCHENEFTLSNGTDEAIQVLINTYVDDGDDVVLLRPSYAMYRFYAEVAGGSVREIDYRPETLEFPLEELIGALTPHTRAVLIANPNNPTGSAIDLAGIIRILNHAPNAAVLIDEAYYEFYGITALPLIKDYPNLFVSRTFSKAYGMAAMRVGCLFSQAANVAYLHKAQSPYSVNAIAATAVRAAVEDKHYVTEFVNEVLTAREELYSGFRALGVDYIPSHGNFVLFRCGERAIAIRDRLRDMGVLVRDRSYELPGFVRVTVGTRAQVARFLTALEQIW
jgi:histidinol-phosphate aminotransferase